MTLTSREIRLAARPSSVAADPSCFAVETTTVADPGPDEVQVQSLYMSVDPYMRGRMNDVKSYTPPFEIGKALEGGSVGVVTKSRDERVAEGALVTSNLGWREAYTVAATQVQVLPEPPAGVRPSAYLGALGMPGLTAWIGITQIAPVAEGDVVFVSGASGAVGSVAGQLAKARGAAQVIGSAGAADKVVAVTEDFGFDAAFSYRDGPSAQALSRLAPQGIDVYFDNVGGEQLRAAITAARAFGRFALCGSISSGYGTKPGEAIDNLALAVGKRLTLRGYIVSDHFDQMEAFRAEVGRMLADGRLRTRETVVAGIEAAPQAFLDLFAGGGQIGKVVIQLGGDPR